MNGFLSPKEVTEKVVEISKNKSELQILPMLLLGMLAGVYIGFGAELCTMVTHDLSKYLGVGFAKFIGGSVFTVGLMLVVLAGAELFTGMKSYSLFWSFGRFSANKHTVLPYIFLPFNRRIIPAVEHF